MSNGKKLALINDIASQLEAEGTTLTPNAIRARLKGAMLHLAKESCRAIGAEMDDEEMERIASSRAFQEAVSAMLNGDEA